ncbi:MAG: endoribonuclease MazF [Nitrospinota bacterium]
MVRAKRYIPDRGDLVWLQFNPSAGHEQGGKRPAIVLSPKEYNRKTGLLIACPVSSRAKGYPFEVDLPEEGKIAGVVLSDHIKNLDWRARKASFICKADPGVVEEVLGKFNALTD